MANGDREVYGVSDAGQHASSDLVRTFALKHRVRAKRDECGDSIVTGKLGHIGEHGNGFFSIVLEDTASGPSRRRALLNRRRKAVAAGFRLHQAGDCESVLLFDPTDYRQARAAIRIVGVKTRRTCSTEQLEHLKRIREAARIAKSPPPGASQPARNAADRKLKERGEEGPARGFLGSEMF